MHRQVVRTIDQPAAGADWSFVPANGAWTLLQSITGQLVTSATVANRAVRLRVKDANGDLLSVDRSQYAHAASTTVVYGFRTDAPSAGVGVSDQTVILTAPQFWLPPGAVVSSTTLNIAAADQWSALVATFLVGDDWHAMQLEAAIRQILGG